VKGLDMVDLNNTLCINDKVELFFRGQIRTGVIMRKAPKKSAKTRRLWWWIKVDGMEGYGSMALKPESLIRKI